MLGNCHVEAISSQLFKMSASDSKQKSKKKTTSFKMDVSTKRTQPSSWSMEKRKKRDSENIGHGADTFPLSNEWDDDRMNNENETMSNDNETMSNENKRSFENHGESKDFKKVICGTMNLFDSKRSNFSYYLESNKRALLRCCADTVINFNGVIRVKVLQGAIRICGYSVSKRESPALCVYSLNAYNYLPIELLRLGSTTMKKNKLTKALREFDVSEANIQAIVSCLEPHHCLLYIENAVESRLDESNKILFNMIERLNYSIPSLLPDKSFFHRSQEPAELLEKHLKIRFLKTINSSVGAPVLMQPDTWNTLYEQCVKTDQNAHLVLCGGSGVGKTTLLRYLVNRSIQEFGKALVLDLDPGQSEFFLPGTLSASIIDSPILGPNFTHVRYRKPVRAYFLGEIKVHSNAHLYVKYTQALLDFCHSREDLSHVPWFVNTMGYVRDQGIGLNCRVIQDTQPTHVIQIRGRKADENFPADLTWNYVNKNAYQPHNIPHSSNPKPLNYELFPLDSVKMKPFENMNKCLKPADRRKIMLTAYFSPLFSTIPEDYTVNHCVPFGAKLKHLQVDMTNKGGTQLSRGEILVAMNGELVALTGHLSMNESPQCLGYGIVYCIDPATQELFLVSPLSLSHMASVKTLLLGAPSISLPRKFLDGRCKELMGHRLPYASTSVGEAQVTSQAASRSFRQPGRYMQRGQRH